MRCDALISWGPGEWRAAWLEDGAVVELLVERDDVKPAGSIHLGRVVQRIGGLDAALVDFGEARPGFLPAPGGLAEGARACVEVRRETQRDKGALLSTRLAEDAAGLARLAAGREPPAQLAPMPGFAAALAWRLPGRPDSVSTDDRGTLRDLRAAFPAAEVGYCDPADWPIDLGAAVDAALSPTLSLAGGGAIHIAECRAAVLIDVDTGSPAGGPAGRAAMAINVAAAAAIARQLRLRQLGGGIIVDFAALDGRANRERVRTAVAAALAHDPARPQVLGWTRLGHLEIVRPRRSRPLSAAMLETETTRRSAAALAFEALRRLAREARARPAARWQLVVAAPVAAALAGPAAAGLRTLEERLGRPIAVAVAPAGEASASDPGFYPGFDIVAL